MSLHSVQLLVLSVQSNTIAHISDSVQQQTWSQEINNFLDVVDFVFDKMEEEVNHA